jgi:hypothetical protein
MQKKYYAVLAALLIFWSYGSGQENGTAGTFSFELNFSYPGDPVFVYDHLTGDISEWWDHSFSEKPYKLFIEARPGGGFYELFDASGDGALHATVTYAEKGRMLRMEGPLGLAGQALTLVCTYTLKASGSDQTLLTLNVNGAGEFTMETPELVQRVWDHFLREQFKPYIEEQYAHR